MISRTVTVTTQAGLNKAIEGKIDWIEGLRFLDGHGLRFLDGHGLRFRRCPPA